MTPNNRGFSLIEFLIAIAIMGLISLGLSLVVIEQMKTMKDIDLIVAVENDFNSISKTVRTPSEVGRLLGLKIEVSGEWIDNPIPNALTQCLQGQGTSCQSSFDAWAPLPDPAGFLNSKAQRLGPCPTSTLCEYERITQYRAECDTSRCYSLSFLVRIVPLNTASFRERRVEMRMNPGLVLSRRDINFACAGSSGYVTSVDFKNLRAVCGAVGGPGPSPLVSKLSHTLYPIQPPPPATPIHKCPKGETSCKAFTAAERECDAGFTSISLFNGTCI